MKTNELLTYIITYIITYYNPLKEFINVSKIKPSRGLNDKVVKITNEFGTIIGYLKLDFTDLLILETKDILQPGTKKPSSI